jgi:hypothetical protein
VMSTAMFAGMDASGRARRAGHSAIARAQRLMIADGLGGPTETSIEVIGAGATSADATLRTADEVVLKVGLRHRNKDALEIFSREFATMGLVAQGLTGLFAGRARVAPVYKVLHLLVSKSLVPLKIELGRSTLDAEVFLGSQDAVVATPQMAEPPATRQNKDSVIVPLRTIAWARSGDKGDKANIGVIARRPEFVAILREQVTCARVTEMFRHYLKGPVHRWELPGQNAINLLLDAVLGGAGGTSTLRYDPQGKSYAAMLLAMPVYVPATWDHLGLLGSEAAA